MIYGYTVTADELARRLMSSLHDELEKKIKDALLKECDKIVTEVAHDLAKGLHGNIRTIRHLEKDELIVSLVLNGKTTLIEGE